MDWSFGASSRKGPEPKGRQGCPCLEAAHRGFWSHRWSRAEYFEQGRPVFRRLPIMIDDDTVIAKQFPNSEFRRVTEADFGVRGYPAIRLNDARDIQGPAVGFLYGIEFIPGPSAKFLRSEQRKGPVAAIFAEFHGPPPNGIPIALFPGAKS